MEKEYAYFNVGVTGRGSSEGYVQSWIERVLNLSTLDPEAKKLINSQSLLPVEFKVFEDSTDEGAEPIIVEREEVPLWHILTDQYPWQSSYGKRQVESNVQVTVQMPAFYEGLTRELTHTRFLLGSIRISGQTSVNGLTKQNLVLPAVTLSKNEVVLLSVWSVSKLLMAEIWFDVSPAYRGASQWPKQISDHWPGMRIGNQVGNFFHYSTDPTKNDLWLKSFDEPVLDADISIYPRWTLLQLPLPDSDLESFQVVVVSVENIPGGLGKQRYVIKVPSTLWAREQWTYYVGVYLSYRCPWLHYGALDQEGSIAPLRNQRNVWFARSDASQLLVSIRIVPFELVQWADERAGATPPSVAAKSWQKWDGLLTAVESVGLVKDYMRMLADRSLAKSGLPEQTQKDFKVQKEFRYKYQAGHAVYSPGFTAYVPPRYRYFSFEQVLVGEPQRSEFIQERVAAVHVQGQALSEVEVKALGGLRDILLTEFSSDIDTFVNTADYKQLFGETCDALARVRVGKFLADDSENDEALRECAFAYLYGSLKPRLLLFREKVVPNVFVLKHDSQKALLVSLNGNGLKWVKWQPSTASGQPSEALMAFITFHLPFPDKASIGRNDYYPKKKRYGYHYRRRPPEPVSFLEVANINESLLEVAVTELKKQMDYAVFSSDEERERAKVQLFKTTIRAVAGLVIAAVGPLSGIGALLLSGGARLMANIGDASASYLLAQQADRPEEIAAYIQECKMGVLFGLIDLGSDISLARQKLRVVLKQSTQAGKAFFPFLNKPKPMDSPLKLERESESDVFMPTPYWLKGVRERLEKAYRDDGKLSQLKSALQVSVTSGYVETKGCADYLLGKSWSVQAIGVLIFTKLSDDRPKAHFALCIRTQEDSAVLDVRLSQLASSGEARRAYFGSFESWRERLQSLPDLQEKLVVCKFYGHIAEASHEMDALFPLGVSWGRFFNIGSYQVINGSSRLTLLLNAQLQRLWSSIFNLLSGDAMADTTTHGPLAFNQAELLMQVSNLKGFIHESEQMLRHTIGIHAIGELRSEVLGFVQAWRAEAMEGGGRALVDGVMTEEAGLVRNALTHLNVLQVGVDSPVASTENAMVDCIDWVATRAGQDDDGWQALLKAELERYVSGERSGSDICLRTTLDQLHATLAKGKQVRTHHLRDATYERLSPISGRVLFETGLGLIRGMDAKRQADCLFALIMTYQPYDDSNELFARIVYGISALRQKHFMVLTLAHESRLSGLEPANAMLF